MGEQQGWAEVEVEPSGGKVVGVAYMVDIGS